MSKKVEESVVEEPQIEEPVDDEGEESDEYDNIEDEGDEEAGGYEQDEEGDEEGDEANLTTEGSNLTALLLGGEGAAEVEEDEDEDDEFNPTVAENGITQAGLPTAVAEPPSGISAPALGKKRSRQDTEAEDVTGDYGEVDENSETVLKKARAAAAEPEGPQVTVEEV